MQHEQHAHRHADGTECNCEHDGPEPTKSVTEGAPAKSHVHGSPHAGHDHGSGHAQAAPAAAHLVKDPVCGMDVDPHTAKHRADYAGHTYYF